MGPWRPKWAQKRPKQPKMGPNAPKMTPNLVKGFPHVRPPYHHVFGPPTPGWRRSATLLLKMAKNGPLEAEMGPKKAKTAQNGPKCPQNDPKPRQKVPVRKATLSACVWTPNSRVAPVGSHITAKKWPKMGPWRPKWTQKGPTAPSNKQVGFIRYLGFADRLRPQTWPEGAPG